jgi:hypothetical protein
MAKTKSASPSATVLPRRKKAEASRGDQLQARDEDREVLDLARAERHPVSERPGRRQGACRFDPPRRSCVRIRNFEQAPEVEDDEQSADRGADDTANHRGGAFRSRGLAEDDWPNDTHRREGSEVAECESSGVR